MFDLFRSREKSVRYLLGGLLGLVALSMVTYLIPGAGGFGGETTDEQTVATIGSERITSREIALALQNATRNRQIPPGMEEFLIPQLVNQLVAERAVAFQAEQMGMKVTPDDLANTIYSLVPDLVQNGKFIGKDMYTRFLAQNNLSVPEFERNVKNQMLITRLRNMVADGVVITPQEVEQAYHEKNDKAKIEYVSFSSTKLQSEINPSAAELQTYFNSKPGSYMTPERRSFQMIVFSEQQMAQSVKPSEAEMRTYYQQNQDSYRVPERVHARHILIKTQGKPADQQAKLEKDAQDILKQVKGGADFAELAKKSEDPGSAAKGGDLGWLTRGQTVQSFEQAAFTLKPNEISDLVKTEYGFHIIQVLEHEQAHLRTFAEVQPEIAAELGRRQAAEKIQQTVERAQSEAAKNPGAMQQIAQKYGAQYATVDKQVPGEQIPIVGASQEVTAQVTSLAKGVVSQPVSAGEGRVAIIDVTDIVPAKQASFAEVESRVKADYVKAKADELVTKRAAEAAQKAKSTGDLKAVAEQFKGEYKSIPTFSQGEAAEGIGLSSYVNEAFTQPVGTVVGPVQVPDQTIIYKVIGKEVADNAKLAESKGSLIESLKQRKARERVDLFEDGILKKLTDSGKVKIHEDVVKRLAAGNRG